MLLAHGTADDSIPFTESVRLAEAAGPHARLALFHTFHHTGPAPFWASLRMQLGDGWQLVSLVDELLRYERREPSASLAPSTRSTYRVRLAAASGAASQLDPSHRSSRVPDRLPRGRPLR